MLHAAVVDYHSPDNGVIYGAPWTTPWATCMLWNGPRLTMGHNFTMGCTMGHVMVYHGRPRAYL